MQMLDPAGVEPNSDQPVSGACHDDASAAPGNAMPRRPDRVRGDDRSPMSNSGGSSKVVDGGNGHLCVATGARQRGATSCRAVTGATGYPGRLRHRAAVPRVPGRLPDLAWTGRPAEHAPQRLGGGRPAGGWYARATRPQRRAAPGHRAARNSPRSSPTCSFRRRPNSSAPTPRSLDGSAPPCFEWPHRSAVGHVGAPGVGLPGLVRPPGRGRGGWQRQSRAVGTSAGRATGYHEHRAVAAPLDGRSTTGSSAHRVTARMIPQGTG